MNELKYPKQIGFGLVSVLIGLCNIGYALMIAGSIAFKNDFFFKRVADLIPKSGPGEIGFGLWAIFLIFLIIPIGGAIVGAMFGVIGVASPRFKRSLGVAGILLNLVVPGIMFLGWLYIIVGAPGLSRT